MAEHPQKLGKYEIRRELGRGAMGVVFDAWDPSLERRVALKTVRRDQLDGAEAKELLDRFKREAQAAGRLSHPNIVAVYEYGEDEGIAFIAMEYIEGRELKEYFDGNERFPLPEVGRIMGQLLDALGVAHAHGIVHRDIKPANVFVLAGGQIKVGDFGIARIESSNLTQAGSVLGTPAYMSPEQFMGQTVDGRSDLFSAGVILYQFLTGEKPFTGQLTTIMHKVLREDPTAPSELNVQIPKSFDKLIGKALAKRPEDRFQSAREFAVALQAVIGGVAADSEATIAIAPAAAPAATRARPSTETPAEPPVVRPSPALPPARSPALTFAVIGGVVVLGLGAALYYVNRSSAPSAPSAPLSEVPPAAAPSVGSVPANATAPAPQAARPTDLVISAVGFADPSDPRYGSDPGLLRAELREDARRQLVEKAIALYVQSGSLLQNYDRLQGRLLARSGEFIDTVIQEETPRTGKDGLVSVTTRASVRVRDVQKTLNQMSREERIDFIRNNGDPKISVAISTRPETGEAQRSPVAENLLKEHIQSFGFRTFNESGGETRADFMVTGEAKFKKLSTTLAASGLTIEKTVLTSWTVKCIDKLTGEEIYFNTQIPEKQSWASEDQALAEIGRLIGEEFSKNFFLQHFHFTGQKVVLRLAGLPDRTIGEKLQREITGLRSVLDVKGIDVSTLEVRLAGSAGSPADLVAAGVTQPINHKLGRTCLSVNGQNGAEVILALDATCLDSTVLGKLDSLPAAALYDAPPVRRNAIVKNPETLRKMAI